MDYELLDTAAQVRHLQNRLGNLEQQHYATSINIELFERTGDTDAEAYAQEKAKLADTEKVHEQVKILLAELKATIPVESEAPDAQAG